jgi:hypothetical protein
MNNVALRCFSFSLLMLLSVGSFCAHAAQAQECHPTPSWIFRPSTYTHAPETGARVAQYQRIAPVEGLDDPRLYTSGYRRTRTTLRGADGSVDATYQVQNWGNGRGGLDAEWERFHDAWLQSYMSGGNYSGYAAPYGAGFFGQGPHGHGGYPGYGHPGPGGYGHPFPHAAPYGPHGGHYGGNYGGPYGPAAGGVAPPWAAPRP